MQLVLRVAVVVGLLRWGRYLAAARVLLELLLQVGFDARPSRCSLA